MECIIRELGCCFRRSAANASTEWEPIGAFALEVRMRVGVLPYDGHCIFCGLRSREINCTRCFLVESYILE